MTQTLNSAQPTVTAPKARNSGERKYGSRKHQAPNMPIGLVTRHQFISMVWPRMERRPQSRIVAHTGGIQAVTANAVRNSGSSRICLITAQTTPIATSAATIATPNWAWLSRGISSSRPYL
jgi:hypothetical protein